MLSTVTRVFYRQKCLLFPYDGSEEIRLFEKMNISDI